MTLVADETRLLRSSPLPSRRHPTIPDIPTKTCTRTTVGRRLCLPQIQFGWRAAANRAILTPMTELFNLFWSAILGLFRSRASQEAEIATRRHQLNVLKRQSPKRPTFSTIDRLIFVALYWIAPSVLNALKIVEPEL